ncbi:MAG: GGDEF domain-containing protein [Pseudomonadota bacterium]
MTVIALRFGRLLSNLLKITLFSFALLLGGAASAAERAAPQKPLVLTNSASWLPYAFIDEQGQPRGMLIDLWRLAAERAGIEVAFALVDWQDSLTMLGDGRADAHAGLNVSASHDEAFWFSDGFLSVKTLLFARRGTHTRALAELGRQPVGVVADSFDEEYLTTNLPAIDIVGFANSTAMLDAAIAGDLDHFIADYPTGFYRLLVEGAIDEFEAVEVVFVQALHAAVRNGDRATLAVVDAALGTIDAADVEAIRERWVVPPEPRPPWLIPTVIAACIAVLTAAVLLHYLTLRRAVRTTGAALRASIDQLEALNTALEREANLDPLTGIANRRRFVDIALGEIDRSRRYGRPVTLALFDVDGFKGINDRLGHMGGDAALRAIADALRFVVRRTDLPARLGGDEFVVLMPEVDVDEAEWLARRAVAAVHGLNFAHDGRSASLGLSWGVAGLAGGQSLEAWLGAADAELYRRKAARRTTARGSPEAGAPTGSGVGLPAGSASPVLR